MPSALRQGIQVNKRDALATFQALVASVREERMCVLQAISDEGEDIWVCCHVSGDPGDGTMAVVPLARLLSEPEVAGILDRLGVWFVAAALLVALAYVPVFLNQGISLDAPGNSAVYNPQTP